MRITPSIVFILIVLSLLSPPQGRSQNTVLRTLQFFRPLRIHSTALWNGQELVLQADNVIAKLDATGKPVWVTGYDNSGPGVNNIYFTDMTVLNSEIIVAGLYISSDSTVKPFGGIILALDGTGEVKYSRVFNISGGAIGSGPFLRRSSDSTIIFYYSPYNYPTTIIVECNSKLQLQTVPHSLARNEPLGGGPIPFCYRLAGDSAFFFLTVANRSDPNNGSITSIVLHHDSLRVLGRSRCQEGSIIFKRSIDRPSEQMSYVCAEQINTGGSKSNIAVITVPFSGLPASGVSVDVLDGTCDESIDLTSDGKIILSSISCNDSAESKICIFDSSFGLQTVFHPAPIGGNPVPVYATITPADDIILCGSVSHSVPGTHLYQRTTLSLSGCNLQQTLASIQPQSLPRLSDTIFPFTYNPITLEEVPPTVIPMPITIRSDSVWCSTINEVETPSLLQGAAIYPNPVRESPTVTIRLPEYLKSGIKHLRLRSLSGIVVIEQNVNSDADAQLPVTGLSSGMYIVELADANSFAVLWRSKVVIE